MTYRIGIFATGRGTGSRGLLQAIHQGIESRHVPAEVAFVFSNRDRGEFEPTDGFFDQVESYGYPLITSSFRRFRTKVGRDADWRTLYDRDVMVKIAPYALDLCVLAGYLFIHGPEMTTSYTMVNLHPAAPGGPTGMWQDVIWQLIDRKAESSGNTMFHATDELDRGPTVSFSSFRIRGGAFDPAWKTIEGRLAAELRGTEGEELPLFQLIRQHGMVRERPLVVETVKAFAEGAIRVSGGKVLGPNGKPLGALDLTAQIEALVARKGC